MAKHSDKILEFSGDGEETAMSGDFYQMYLEDLETVPPCTAEEQAALLEAAAKGDAEAKNRLVEGNLRKAASYAEEYRDRGLPMGDLIQEANVALLLLAGEIAGGSGDGDFGDGGSGRGDFGEGGSDSGAFDRAMERRVREAIEAALEQQDTEAKVEEEIAARVNVLKDISASMAEELGREATVEELAERMKMTADEIKDIMKLTLDAMSVTGE